MSEFINGLNRNAWAGFFAVLAVGTAIASIKFHDLMPAVTGLIGMAGMAFNGKE